MSTSAQCEQRLHDKNYEATRDWLQQQQQQLETDGASIDMEADDLESIAESSIVDSSSDSNTSDTETDADGCLTTTTALGNCAASSDITAFSLQELLNSINNVQTVANVNIENSTGVHIGNITNINGNIQIIHAGDSCQRLPPKTRRGKSRRSTELNNKTKILPNDVEKEERVSNEAFLQRLKFKMPKELCSIVPRHTWLAQAPMEPYEYMIEPVEYVVILHTATESSEEQAINIRTIRDTQCFHIESRGWNDIAYNFLIGCDGNIYEGRNWAVVGAHTMGYNNRAIGISFIGCFMKVLPTVKALNACKNLLKKGVTDGHLAPDYKLICHCQCRPTQSPGRKLFEEIKEWEHFYNIEEEEDDEEEQREQN